MGTQHAVLSVFAMAAIGLMAAFSPDAALAAPTDADVKPVALRCEYRRGPVGIDVRRPRLSWKLEAVKEGARGVRQTAYEVQVGSGPGKADLWSTGKVVSGEQNQIEYGGKGLTSRQECYWRVRVWDGAGNISAWSDEARWSMGLLEKGDWKAEWIGYDAPVDGDRGGEKLTLDGATWVWADEGDPKAKAPAETVYFRKTVEVPAGRTLVTAELMMSADNAFTAFVNGQNAAQGGNFKQAVLKDITPMVKAGGNVIAVSATNADVGPAGLVGRVRFTFAEGTPVVVEMDSSWKASKGKAEGWENVGFDDSGWGRAKELGKVPVGPWGKVEGGGLELPPVPYVRKSFESAGRVKRATVYATALGLFEVRINGRKVGNDVLTPGWTDFNKRVYYFTYDVTDMIARGENVIATPVADGWFDGYLGYSFKRNNYGGAPRVRVQLEIEYADGSSKTVGTDSSWKASYGPLREADLLMGTTYDATKEIAGWDRPGFDDSKWTMVDVGGRDILVQAHPGDPVRVIEEIPAKAMTEPKSGVYVFDLKQNMVGWARFNLNVKAGQPVTIRYAEMLNPDGTLYTAALRAARATDTYIPAKDGTVAWSPDFTFHGFQYVELTGVVGRPSLDAVTGIVVHSDMKPSGTFECSNPLVNQLFHNIIWGQKGNYLEIPTDCPQRDERLGWTGDAQFFIRTGAYNFDVAAFFTKWLVDLVEDSQMKNGAYTHVAPAVNYNDGGGTAWQDAAVICTHAIYRFYGDTRIVAEHWPSLTRYMGYLKDTSKDYVRNDKPFGDWLNQGGGAKSEVIGTAYYAYVAGLMSEMARAIGKGDEAKAYAELAQKVTAKFRSEFLNPDGSIKESSQTGYALAFTMGLIPEELKAKSAEKFVGEIEKKDWHLATGFIGTPRLLPALSKAGRTDVAYRLLLTETFPSWLFPVTLGATTMWERWDGYRPDKGFQDPGMNSFNHYAFGSVGQWLYESCVGIRPVSPGFRMVTLRPVPDERLEWAKGTYDSVRGEIVSSWKREGGRVTYEFVVPANVLATVHVPTSDVSSVTESGKAAGQSPGVEFVQMENGAAVYRVGSGRYRFSARP